MCHVTNCVCVCVCDSRIQKTTGLTLHYSLEVIIVIQNVKYYNISGSKVSDYCASKYGSVGFSECLLEELQGTFSVLGVLPFYSRLTLFSRSMSL